jgi:hypothetical protein
MPKLSRALGHQVLGGKEATSEARRRIAQLDIDKEAPVRARPSRRCREFSDLVQ